MLAEYQVEQIVEGFENRISDAQIALNTIVYGLTAEINACSYAERFGGEVKSRKDYIEGVVKVLAELQDRLSTIRDDFTDTIISPYHLVSEFMPDGN